jgi:hypothetical protein
MAARYKLTGHSFTHKGNTYNVILPDVYGGNSSAIESATGIGKGGSDTAVVSLSASDAMKNGLVGRVRITHGPTGDKKSTKIYCAVSKMDSVIGSITGKQYLGREITSAAFPRRRKLG